MIPVALVTSVPDSATLLIPTTSRSTQSNVTPDMIAIT
jgi:hypothetical protein